MNDTTTAAIPMPRLKKNRERGSRAPHRLVRRAGSVWLRFEPPLICDCGGEVDVKDWEARTEMRYEASCNKCLSCDPNGWPTQAEIIANSPAYFRRVNDKQHE